MNRITAPLLCLALCWAAPWRAHAVGQELSWFISPDDDLAAWSAAVAETWPEGGLKVEVWIEGWPPPIDWRFAHGFLDGELPGGTVVLRPGDGSERRVPALFGNATVEEARRSVLLLLKGIWTPLAVDDYGWIPEEPVDTGPVDLVDGGAFDPLPVRYRLWFGVGIGASFRFGISGSFFPSARVAVNLGTDPRVGVHWGVNLGWNVPGRTTISRYYNQTLYDQIPINLNGISGVTGPELRIALRRSAVLMWIGGGGRLFIAKLVNGGDPPVYRLVRHIRIGAGWSSEPIRKQLRVRSCVIVGIDMIAPSVDFELGGEIYKGPLPVTLGLQIGLEVGSLPVETFR